MKAMKLDRRSAEKLAEEYPDSFTKKERRKFKRRPKPKNKTKRQKQSRRVPPKYGRTIVIRRNANGDLVKRPNSKILEQY